MAGANVNLNDNDIPNQNAPMDEECEQIEYSTNDVFDCIVENDPTVEVAGYVTEVIAARDVGPKNQYRLFKFALSNGDDDNSRKIYCCVWGRELIAVIEPRITPNRIVRVAGAKSKTSKPSFHKINEGFVSFELHIGSSTDVITRGIHKNANEVPAQVAPILVDFETIANHNQGTLVTITGNLRQPFRVIQNRYGNSSYGNCAITNSTEKVNVSITKYETLDIPLGCNVTVTGTLDINNGPTTVICPDTASVVPNTSASIMPANVLKNGNRFPKRKSPPS